MTTVQRAAQIFGVVFLLVGLAGFFVTGLSMESDPEAAPHLFGLFPVNALHNVVHLLFGVWGLLASRSLSGSRGYFRAVAIIYAVLTVMGLVPGLQTTFGLIPLYGADVALHAVLAIVAAYFGWMNRDDGARDRV